MAHFEKFKRGDAKRVQREAFRDCDSKSEFYDKGQSINNKYYASKKTIQDWIDEYKPPRKNSIITINEVITRPKGIKDEDAEEFYKFAAEFTKNMLHSKSVLYLTIHRDEKTEHAHISYLALNKETEKWQARDMLNKSFLMKYHRALEEAAKEKFGYLIEIRKDNQEPHLSFDEYKQKMKEQDLEQEEDKNRLFDI